MSNHLAIATVTTGLLRYLQGAVGADVGNATVTAVRPDGPNAGLPQVGVNIFLYQVTPNTAWRNHDLPTRRGDGSLTQRPQIALDLHFYSPSTATRRCWSRSGFWAAPSAPSTPAPCSRGRRFAVRWRRLPF